MSEETKPIPWWKRKYVRIGVILVTIGIMVTLVIFGLRESESIEKFRDNEYIGIFGYVFIFLMGIAGSAAPIWPLPGSWSAFIAAGLGWNVIYVALAAGTGECIGEITGYMLGYGGQPALANWKKYQRLESWMKRHGTIAVFLFAAVPNPHLIKLVNAAAGALRFPLWKWVILTWLGKTIKSFGFAFAGIGLFGFIENWFE
jgi:uncharacterized membrane protein YdjX (TVP38/TMEM64 family)